MLPNTLNTNEIKNSAGTEVEFQRIDTGPGRTTVFAQIGETLSLPHRLSIKHTETGTGINAKRRSLVRFDKTVISTVDATKAVVCTDYWVHEVPIGALNANTEPANVLAELMSFVASLGTTTTILYDGTGNGARELLNGGL
jgi:hypothetical protein